MKPCAGMNGKEETKKGNENFNNVRQGGNSTFSRFKFWARH